MKVPHSPQTCNQRVRMLLTRLLKELWKGCMEGGMEARSKVCRFCFLSLTCIPVASGEPVGSVVYSCWGGLWKRVDTSLQICKWKPSRVAFTACNPFPSAPPLLWGRTSQHAWDGWGKEQGNKKATNHMNWLCEGKSLLYNSREAGKGRTLQAV